HPIGCAPLRLTSGQPTLLDELLEELLLDWLPPAWHWHCGGRCREFSAHDFPVRQFRSLFAWPPGKTRSAHARRRGADRKHDGVRLRSMGTISSEYSGATSAFRSSGCCAATG